MQARAASSSRKRKGGMVRGPKPLPYLYTYPCACTGPNRKRKAAAVGPALPARPHEEAQEPERCCLLRGAF